MLLYDHTRRVGFYFISSGEGLTRGVRRETHVCRRRRRARVRAYCRYNAVRVRTDENTRRETCPGEPQRARWLHRPRAISTRTRPNSGRAVAVPRGESKTAVDGQQSRGGRALFCRSARPYGGTDTGSRAREKHNGVFTC